MMNTPEGFTLSLFGLTWTEIELIRILASLQRELGEKPTPENVAELLRRIPRTRGTP